MKKNKLNYDAYRNFALITQLGIHVLSPVFLCVALGVVCDQRFGTYLTLPLLILGILAGGRNGYILAKRVNVESEGQKRSREEQQLVDEALEKWNDGRDETRSSEKSDL